MKYIVVSDLHLGKGKFFSNGHFNILEDFFEDERFYEFCEYFSSGKYFLKKVCLILNGDILNLIQIDKNGVFTHFVDEEMTEEQIRNIAKGHSKFFKGLKRFLKSPNKEIIYVIGNHDNGMAFEGAQRVFNELVGGEVTFTHTFKRDGVHVEHGHRFEAINTVSHKNYFIEGPTGKKILNFPWGSLFCINVLPILKKERPYIDKVRPMGAYVKWCLIHDTAFFWKLLITCVKYVMKTYSDYYTKQNKNFKTTLKILKQITIYPRYERMAKRIIKKDRSIHTVIMGHTHLQEWRRFPSGKYYFNTGTWNTIPSIDAGMHQDTRHLTFCTVNVDEKSGQLMTASINEWKGNWKPYLEEVSTH
ncbi:MAG: metallophosphoesterase [Bdellovibrionota bacterium]|nr:metallophosphoesterase [Bdellovibrionota bacterium]